MYVIRPSSMVNLARPQRFQVQGRIRGQTLCPVRKKTEPEKVSVPPTPPNVKKEIRDLMSTGFSWAIFGWAIDKHYIAIGPVYAIIRNLEKVDDQHRQAGFEWKLPPLP